jgi:hypothetical protein
VADDGKNIKGAEEGYEGIVDRVGITAGSSEEKFSLE